MRDGLQFCSAPAERVLSQSGLRPNRARMIEKVLEELEHFLNAMNSDDVRNVMMSCEA